MATSLAGKPLVEASWALLKRDPSMVVLLVVGGLASSLAFALVALPTYLIVGLPVDGRGDPLGLVVYAVAVFASTLVSTFFLGAVVDAAMQRADGGDPTFGTAMAAAWERRNQLIAWAAMAAAVAVALRLLQRFGLAGAIVRLLAGVSWAVATAFAIPVIMAEGTMPLETVKRSAHVLTSRFGSNARATLRFGVVVILVWLGLFAMGMVGIYGVYDGSTHRNGVTLAIGGLLLVVAVLGGFIASAVVSALSAYLRTVLYRYATGLPTPGIDPWVLPPLLPEPPAGPGGLGGLGGPGGLDGPPPGAVGRRRPVGARAVAVRVAGRVVARARPVGVGAVGRRRPVGARAVAVRVAGRVVARARPVGVRRTAGTPGTPGAPCRASTPGGRRRTGPAESRPRTGAGPDLAVPAGAGVPARGPGLTTGR